MLLSWRHFGLTQRQGKRVGQVVAGFIGFDHRINIPVGGSYIWVGKFLPVLLNESFARCLLYTSDAADE